MKYGLMSGLLWALDTVLLGLALTLSPFSDSPEVLLLAPIVSAFLHDFFCAVWMFALLAIKKRLGRVFEASRTSSGQIVMLGALLGGPLGMTGYVLAIKYIGPGYTAAISAFYPAFGAALAHILLKERLTILQTVSLLVAVSGIVGIGYLSSESTTVLNPVLGIGAALLCVIGWGSEAVLGAWGMRHALIDNEIALSIRETVSALSYALIVLPLFGAWAAVLECSPTWAAGSIALCALVGTLSYLFYYLAIRTIGAARGMALNISYSAWAFLLSIVVFGTIPSLLEWVLCALILIGTIFAACRPQELFHR